VSIWGTGKATRDFLHVADAARGIADAVEKNVHYDSPINLGSGQETSISDLANMIGKIYGVDEIKWDVNRAEGVQRRLLDTERAQTELGWEPQIKLEEGLRETIRWYEDRYNV
jgi:GDP-L-fucose synthase